MSTIQIKSILESLEHFKHNWKFTLLSQWPSIIGSLGEQIVLEKINNDSIVLGVVDSCWMQELHALTPLVQSLINKSLDEPRIQKIYFKTKQSHKKNISVYPIVAKKIVLDQDVPLSAKELSALASVQDVDLKKSLTLFRNRCSRNTTP